MAYRDDVQALEARVAALSAAVAERTRERDDAARLLDEARARANAEAFIADLESGGPARRRRKRLRIAAIAAGVAMIIGGAFAVRASHRDHRFDDAMRALTHFTDEMCACHDTTSATRVSDEMTRWSVAMSKAWEPAPKLSDAQVQRATALGQHMAECMSSAMRAGEPQWQLRPVDEPGPQAAD